MCYFLHLFCKMHIFEEAHVRGWHCSIAYRILQGNSFFVQLIQYLKCTTEWMRQAVPLFHVLLKNCFKTVLVLYRNTVCYLSISDFSHFLEGEIRWFENLKILCYFQMHNCNLLLIFSITMLLLFWYLLRCL